MDIVVGTEAGLAFVYRGYESAAGLTGVPAASLSTPPPLSAESWGASVANQ